MYCLYEEKKFSGLCSPGRCKALRAVAVSQAGSPPQGGAARSASSSSLSAEPGMSTAPCIQKSVPALSADHLRY